MKVRLKDHETNRSIDRLDDMWYRQAELNDYIRDKREEADELFTEGELLQKQVMAMLAELVEFQEELDWKWWTNDREIDKDAAKEELVDLFHFLITAAQGLGMDAEEFYHIYVEKNNENMDRQDGETHRKGYDADSDEEYVSPDKGDN